MTERYFHVSKYPQGDDKPRDIGFSPINDKPIPKEYLKFKSDVESLITTINNIFDDESNRLNYYDQVFYAASLCFSGEKHDFPVANQTLEDIKSDIFKHHWSRIRNNTLTIYGQCVLKISIVFIVLYGFSYFFKSDWSFYFVSLIGTCIGSWLSFAIRSNNLLFEDITQCIFEVKEPYIRCIFTCVLSFVFIMLLQVGFIDFNIGGISSKSIQTNLEVALTLGLLFGFSEKTLITTLGKKSTGLFK
ncbi:hypothetical protein HJ001_24225 [Vibrio parahaemolyticus]|uniref:hypothetical protein n=2 Tax=Vibrio harveyi group TaxID=717610 RepID=UPI00148D9138|nr:hypothetical protein [Vibrio alginolyticus]MBE3816781.1 hypothetical protein [Vibrio parahaemolyticus]MBE3884521.1 hypothetical protein [Vibrio parahaemolyticus]MBE4177755.1 hypothetical protein [Vibrio parahaemolyticus]MBE4281776.1 hypothetical protein [Vibrio parahaemolyticus]MBE4530770.1 hypothetical protein [Vibrio parahaemolyticus]